MQDEVPAHVGPHIEADVQWQPTLIQQYAQPVNCINTLRFLEQGCSTMLQRLQYFLLVPVQVRIMRIVAWQFDSKLFLINDSDKAVTIQPHRLLPPAYYERDSDVPPSPFLDHDSPG